ncbi:MAG: response regulator [Myxococcaceae bacterium]
MRAHDSAVAPETTQASSVAQRESSDSRKAADRIRKSVLVVEDDPANRELMVEMLSMWGYRAIPVGSAEEAEFAIRSRRPDAALVDVFLPGQSGVTLMAKLRERFPDAMLIGMSALSDTAMARRCKGLGADLFIGKPISPEKLSQALQSPRRDWH